VVRQLLVNVTEKRAGFRILHALEVPVPAAVDDPIEEHPTAGLSEEVVARLLLEEGLLLARRSRFQAKLRLQLDGRLEVDAE
jgi:hypothetical protein